MDLIFVPEADAIPKIIHQTYPTRALPGPLQENVDNIKRSHPAWEYRFYDDDEMHAYIRSHFGTSVFDLLARLAPEYGVAWSDVFRYMLMYRDGGVYLDIKSRPVRTLDELLVPDRRLITAQWGLAEGRPFGRHRELWRVPGGEYQQWHIAAAPGHPVMRHVLLQVLENIESYSPWRFGVGKKGVIAVTGPIAYTKAILACPDLSDVYVADSHAALGLQYSAVGNHTVHFGRHYSHYDTPLIEPRSRLERLSAAAFRRLRRQWLRIIRSSARPAPNQGAPASAD